MKRKEKNAAEQQRIDALTPEERALEDQKALEEKEAREKRRNEFVAGRDQRVRDKGMVKVALDLGYEGMMSESEARSLAAQISNSHGANVVCMYECICMYVCMHACMHVFEWIWGMRG
jgi:hypothetical protein